MFYYYILRAARDEISPADRGKLQFLWTAVFFVMLLALRLGSKQELLARKGDTES
jgi:AAA family ATP:ADP antiporter